MKTYAVYAMFEADRADRHETIVRTDDKDVVLGADGMDMPMTFGDTLMSRITPGRTTFQEVMQQFSSMAYYSLDSQ